MASRATECSAAQGAAAAAAALILLGSVWGNAKPKPHLILALEAKHPEEERPQGRLSKLPYKPTLLVRERHPHCSLVGITHYFPSIINPIPDHPIHASIDIQKTHNREALPWAPPQ